MTTSAIATGKRAVYPAYKPSGVEWLGEIPEQWNMKRLRFVTKVNPSRAEINGLPEDTQVSFVPMEAVGEYGGMRLDGTKPLAEVTTGYTYFRDGDVLVAKITPCFENGKGSIAQDLENGIGFGTTELHVLRPAIDLERRFLFYLTISHSFRNLGAACMYGAGGQKRVPDDFVRDFRSPLPTLNEQRAIADFLDRETTRIDDLIAKKQRQIELLQEKRAALISHTVTKGLNPNAKMKPSGIEWLGDVPAHWEVKALKHIARIGNGSTPSRENSGYWLDGDYPWLNSSVVNREEVDEPVEFVTTLALRECHLPKIKPPAVLVGITGEGKTRGMATTLRIESTINQHLAYLKPIEAVCDVNYLRRVLDRAYQYLRVESDGGGSTKGAITCDQLANLRIPLPPSKEQKTIVAYLNREIMKGTRVAEKVQVSLELLREYRTALVSAAVTGTLDVREEAL